MGFHPQAERHGRLHDSQGGGCPGRSAIDLACEKIVLYDQVRITRASAIDLSKDVAKCFDRMIEACMNLLCHQQGTDPKYLQLHGVMQQHMHYYVKHAIGISEKYNQHTATKPWYGAGQGAGDACLWWIAQANSMILAYESIATPWILTSPNRNQKFTQLLDAFIDDTSIISAKQKHQNFVEHLRTIQGNLDNWHELLQASGGVLNPSKCVWLCFHWKFAPNRVTSHHTISKYTNTTDHDRTATAHPDSPTTTQWSSQIPWNILNNQRQLQKGTGDIPTMAMEIHYSPSELPLPILWRTSDLQTMLSSNSGISFTSNRNTTS